MTNREKAKELVAEAQNFTSGYREKLDTIESALDAERKAGELVGAIEILQRMVTGWGMVSKESVFAELDRLRAEKAKLG